VIPTKTIFFSICSTTLCGTRYARNMFISSKRAIDNIGNYIGASAPRTWPLSSSAPQEGPTAGIIAPRDSPQGGERKAGERVLI